MRGVILIDLSAAKVSELVKELSKRPGVENYPVVSGQRMEIGVAGPAVVLVLSIMTSDEYSDNTKEGF